ncbi:MAG: hypothetical protein RBR35_17585 [Salinivirgaceae bacterium]|nr:hypothetical protein [Salinivirgaceae bacterium]
MEKATIKTSRNYSNGSADVRGVVWDDQEKVEVREAWNIQVVCADLPTESLYGLVLYGLRMVNDIVNSDKNLTSDEDKLESAQQIVTDLVNGDYVWEKERKSKGETIKVSKKALNELTPEEKAHFDELIKKMMKK